MENPSLFATNAAKAARRISAVLLVVGLAACSTAPEWARPGFIYGEDAGAAAADPSSEKDFPELVDVPGQVPERSSAAELKATADGLAADRARARYTDEVLRGGTGTPAQAPRTAAPAPVPAPIATVTPAPSAPADVTNSVASEDGVIAMPARGGRSSPNTSAAQAPAQASEPAARAAATAEVAVEPVPAPEPQVASPAPQATPPAPAPTVAATPVASTPEPVAQPTRRAAVPAVPPVADRVTATTQPRVEASSGATPNYRERPPLPERVATPEVVDIPARATPTIRAASPTTPTEPALRRPVASAPATAAPVARSSTTFEASSAPALAQEALEAAGPIVSSRYGASGAPTGSADPEDPVEVNLDALRGLVGPGASLAPSNEGTNGALYANQGGPGNIPPYVVNFAHGSTGLNAEDKKKIAEAAKSAAAFTGFVRVVGHASSRTGDLGVDQHLLANFGVSLDRATAVANELIRAGVDPARVVVEAKGDTVPVYYESMPAGEAGNRRTEIFIE